LFKKTLALIAVAVVAGLVGLVGLSIVTAQQGPSATRSFDSESVDPRDPVVVTITAANVSDFSWEVVETLPDGFTYDDENPATAEGSADPAVLVMKDGQRVTFTLLAEDTAFTYTVTAPDVTMTKTYEFRGKLKGDTPAEDRDVDGPYMVTVQAAAEPMPEPDTPEPAEEKVSTATGGGGGGGAVAPAPVATPTAVPTAEPTVEPTVEPVPRDRSIVS
jgi:hypothetical protein